MTKAESRSRLVAILAALLVVTLWSSSWMPIKLVLQEIPPLTFAGLRYFIAFLTLAPLAACASNRRILHTISWKAWLTLGALGLLLYSIGVGGQYVALSHLATVTTRLLFAFDTIVVALLSGMLLRERPAWVQWLGIFMALAGIYVYFYPVDVGRSQAIGICASLLGMMGFAVAAIVGRNVGRSRTLPPLLVTAVSMGVGSVVLISCGLLFEGIPAVSLRNWLIILWLSLVNAALAFVVWNYTLRTLTAVESNIITNVMVPEIAVRGWWFLGERLSMLDVVGLSLVVLGTVLVQLGGARLTSRQAIEPG
ncbi:MAG TPA: DMT family transporter [Anaerolineae bacterium]|nr:DMT family transporter [Anaerolineae bacterium]